MMKKRIFAAVLIGSLLSSGLTAMAAAPGPGTAGQSLHREVMRETREMLFEKGLAEPSLYEKLKKEHRGDPDRSALLSPEEADGLFSQVREEFERSLEKESLPGSGDGHTGS